MPYWNLNAYRSLLKTIPNIQKQKQKNSWKHLTKPTVQLVVLNLRIKLINKVQLERKQKRKRSMKTWTMMDSRNMNQVLLLKNNHPLAKMNKHFQLLSKKQTKLIKIKWKKLKTNYHSLWDKFKITELKIGNIANTFKIFCPITVLIQRSWCIVT